MHKKCLLAGEFGPAGLSPAARVAVVSDAEAIRATVPQTIERLSMSTLAPMPAGSPRQRRRGAGTTTTSYASPSPMKRPGTRGH